MNRRKLVVVLARLCRESVHMPLRVDCNNMRWYAGCPALKKGLTTKGDAMSEMLLDMEADQVTASSIEKMDNAGLSSVAEIARAIRRSRRFGAQL